MEYGRNMGKVWIEYRWNMGGMINVIKNMEYLGISKPIFWHCQKLGLFGLYWFRLAWNGLEWMEIGMDVLV